MRAGFPARLIRSQRKTVEAMTTPVNAERNITIAKDAWNFQKRKTMETGKAFCAENTATTVMINSASINTLILPLLRSFYMIIPQKLNLWKTNPMRIWAKEIFDLPVQRCWLSTITSRGGRWLTWQTTYCEWHHSFSGFLIGPHPWIHFPAIGDRFQGENRRSDKGMASLIFVLYDAFESEGFQE